MKKQFFVHCGFPKTATTSLQKHIFPKLDGIDYFGKSHKTGSVFDSTMVRLFREWSDDSPSTSDWRRAVSFLKDISKSSDNNVLISFEEILGPTLRPRSEYHYLFGIKHSRTTRAQIVFLRELLTSAGVCSPHLIVTLREQSALLSSFFAQAYQRIFSNIRRMRTFSQYVDELLNDNADSLLNSDALDYYKLETICTDVFGKDNVHFLSYEWLSSDLQLFASKLSESIGCNELQVLTLLTQSPKENVRRNAGPEHFLRMERRTLLTYATLFKQLVFPNLSLGLGRAIHAQSKILQFGPDRFTPKTTDLLRIRQFYDLSNRQFLARHAGFDGLLSGSSEA